MMLTVYLKNPCKIQSEKSLRTLPVYEAVIKDFEDWQTTDSQLIVSTATDTFYFMLDSVVAWVDGEDDGH